MAAFGAQVSAQLFEDNIATWIVGTVQELLHDGTLKVLSRHQHSLDELMRSKKSRS